MIEFIIWAEVPFRVYAEHQKHEPPDPQPSHYPGCPEAMGIEKIEIAGDELHGLVQPIPADVKVTIEDLYNHILATEDLEQLAWEHKE